MGHYASEMQDDADCERKARKLRAKKIAKDLDKLREAMNEMDAAKDVLVPQRFYGHLDDLENWAKRFE